MTETSAIVPYPAVHAVDGVVAVAETENDPAAEPESPERMFAASSVMSPAVELTVSVTGSMIPELDCVISPSAVAVTVPEVSVTGSSKVSAPPVISATLPEPVGDEMPVVVPHRVGRRADRQRGGI